MDLFWMARHTLTDCLTPEVFVLNRKKLALQFHGFTLNIENELCGKKVLLVCSVSLLTEPWN